MTTPTFEKCPVCSVQIENDAKVNFSYGKSGTRSRLWARVCQFTKNPDCINQCEGKIGDIKDNDYYA